MKVHDTAIIARERELALRRAQHTRHLSRRQGVQRPVALRQEKLLRPRDVSLANEEVQVAELPERQIPVDLSRENRALERNGRDAPGLEQIQQRQELLRSLEVSPRVFLEALPEPAADRLRKGLGADRVQVDVQERRNAVPAGRAKKTLPVQGLLRQSPDPLRVAGPQAGPGAAEEEIALSTHVGSGGAVPPHRKGRPPPAA